VVFKRASYIAESGFENYRESRDANEGLMKRLATLVPLIQYLIVLPICLVIGCDAFLVKFRRAQAGIDKPELSHDIYYGCILLYQILGIVNMKICMRERLFVFIFGGEDGIIDSREQNHLETWLALMTRQIVKEHGAVKGAVVLLGLDDKDYQSLMLDESKPHDKDVVSTSGGWHGSSSMAGNAEGPLASPLLGAHSLPRSSGAAEDSALPFRLPQDSARGLDVPFHPPQSSQEDSSQGSPHPAVAGQVATIAASKQGPPQRSSSSAFSLPSVCSWPQPWDG